jgi:nucleotide-binding universal stress UspA family protein
MYKRVLVPVDGSEVAEAIVPFILDVAGPLDLDLILLRVDQPVAPPVVEGSGRGAVHAALAGVEARHAEAEAYLAGLAAELRTKGVRVTTSVRRGEPVTEIIAAARAEDADLIAMSTYGRTGPARLLFGSVAEGVLRHAGIPVFLVKHTQREIARRRRAASVA